MGYILAKFCYAHKQHFAKPSREDVTMAGKPINEVLANNLRHHMERQELTQMALSAKADLAQTTVSLYLSPGRRQISKSGKVPSAKLSEVESLAAALNIDVWRLLRDFTPAQRLAYESIEAAYLALVPAVSKEAAALLDLNQPTQNHVSVKTPARPEDEKAHDGKSIERKPKVSVVSSQPEPKVPKRQIFTTFGGAAQAKPKVGHASIKVRGVRK